MPYFFKKYAELALILIMTFAFSAEVLYKGARITFDESVQLGTAISFVKGNGFTMPTAYNPDDLSEITHDYLLTWPPPYAFVNGIVYSVVGDIIWSPTIVEIVFILLFGITTFVLMRLLSDHLNFWVRLAIILLWTFTYNPLFGATNTYSMVLYYAAVVVVLMSINHEGLTYRGAVLSGVLVGLSAAFRYAYLPTLAVLPITFVTIALVTRVRRWHYVAVLNTLGGISVFGATWLYNRINADSFVRADMIPKGLFWENLTLFYPLGSGALGVDYGLRYIVNLLGLTFVPYRLISWGISFLIIGLLLFLAWHFLWGGAQKVRDNHAELAQNRFYVFVLSGFLLFTFTIAFLTILSVTNPPEIYGNRPWKYITGDRYYAAVMVWMVFMLGFFLTNVDNVRTRLLRNFPARWLTPVVSLIILIGMAGSTVQEAAFWRNRINNWQPLTSAYEYVPTYSRVFHIFMNHQRDDAPTLAIWGNVFDRRTMAHFVWLAGAYWYDGDLEGVTFKTEQPLRIIVAVPLDQPRDQFPSVDTLMNFVEQHEEAEIIYQIENWAALYLIDL